MAEEGRDHDGLDGCGKTVVVPPRWAETTVEVGKQPVPVTLNDFLEVMRTEMDFYARVRRLELEGMKASLEVIRARIAALQGKEDRNDGY